MKRSKTEVEDLILDQYQSGVFLKTIAANCGVHTATVYSTLKRRGIALRKGSTPIIDIDFEDLLTYSPG